MKAFISALSRAGELNNAALDNMSIPIRCGPGLIGAEGECTKRALGMTLPEVALYEDIFTLSMR